MRLKLFLAFFISLLILVGCSRQVPSLELESSALATPLGRGINLGGGLEQGEEEYNWSFGYTLQPSYFAAIKQAGFQHVRIPVAWSWNISGRYTTLTTAPYTISPQLFARVDWAVAQAKKNGLKVILDDHSHDDLFANAGVSQRSRYYSIWRQIAEHYKNEPNTVYFELLNEPGGALWQNAALWNTILNTTISIIRASNPARGIIVGGVASNSPWTLPLLNLPPNDPNIITTFHYYDPITFTHQGASWAWQPGQQPKNQVWTGGNTGVASSWQLGSWFDTSYTVQSGRKLAVDFTAWGGFNFLPLYGALPIRGFTSISFKTDRATRLAVACNLTASQYVEVTTPGNWGVTTINFSQCGGASRFDAIKIANPSPTPQSVVLQDIRLTGPYGTLTLVTSELEQVQEVFNYVDAWAKANQRSVYLGEFGVNATPSQAGFETWRRLWTSAVRQEAEKRQFAWAYWNFGSRDPANTSFAVYDRLTNTWLTELLKTLIPR